MTYTNSALFQVERVHKLYANEINLIQSYLLKAMKAV